MEEFIPSYEERAGSDANRLLCRTLLTDILQTNALFFTARGNTSIELALKIIRKKGYTTLFIPDQGGWMTYEKYAKKAGLKLYKLLTRRGKFDYKAINSILEAEELLAKDCALLFNSMPAYSFSLGTEKIAQYCKEQGIFLINDVAASIAESDAQYGDIIIGSFGKAKPLPLEEGGFLAIKGKLLSGDESLFGDIHLGDVDIGGVELGEVDTGDVQTGNDDRKTDVGDVDLGKVDIGQVDTGDAPIGTIDSGELLIGTLLLEQEPELDYTRLAKLLETLEERTKNIKNKARELKKRIKQEGIEVMYPEDEGYNVIVPFKNEEEKEKLIKLGESFEDRLEHTICPRYIRVEEKAISFEVKRYFTK